MCVRGSRTSNGRRQHAWATCRRRNRPSGSKNTRIAACLWGPPSYVSAKRLLFAPRTNSNNPYGVSGPLGAGARAVTGALDRVFASTDGHATCSNVVGPGRNFEKMTTLILA